MQHHDHCDVTITAHRETDNLRALVGFTHVFIKINNDKTTDAMAFWCTWQYYDTIQTMLISSSLYKLIITQIGNCQMLMRALIIGNEALLLEIQDLALYHQIIIGPKPLL